MLTWKLTNSTSQAQNSQGPNLHDLTPFNKFLLYNSTMLGLPKYSRYISHDFVLYEYDSIVVESATILTILLYNKLNKIFIFSPLMITKNSLTFFNFPSLFV